jgi:signal transduction histidine kinase
MDSLTRLIAEELRHKVVTYLPDVYGEEWKIPCEELREKIDLKEVQAINNMTKEIDEQGRTYQGSDDTKLAAQIPGHDLLNVSCILRGQIELFEDLPTPEDADNILRLATEYKAHCLAMVYLASNNNQDQPIKDPYYVSVEHLPEILGKRFARYCVNTKQIPPTITMADLACLLQFIKNAGKYGTIIRGKDTGIYNSIEVISDSPLVDENGNPLPKERIPELFGSFSTKGRIGVGLQIAKRLMELQEGFIGVETQGEDNIRYEYNTQSNRVSIVPSREKGTVFRIMYKNQLRTT